MTKLTQYCNYHWYVQESESRTRNQRATLANTDSQVWVFSHLFNPVKSDFPAFVQFIWAGVNTVISGADQDNRNNSLERKWSCSGPKQTLERFFFFVVGTWSNLNLAQLPAVRLTNSMLLYMLNISSLAVFSHLKEGSTSLQSVKQYGIFKTVSRSAFGTVLV